MAEVFSGRGRGRGLIMSRSSPPATADGVHETPRLYGMLTPKYVETGLHWPPQNDYEMTIVVVVFVRGYGEFWVRVLLPR